MYAKGFSALSPGAKWPKGKNVLCDRSVNLGTCSPTMPAHVDRAETYILERDMLNVRYEMGQDFKISTIIIFCLVNRCRISWVPCWPVSGSSKAPRLKHIKLCSQFARRSAVFHPATKPDS
jgi:hypothetical protein